MLYKNIDYTYLSILMGNLHTQLAALAPSVEDAGALLKQKLQSFSSMLDNMPVMDVDTASEGTGFEDFKKALEKALSL